MTALAAFYALDDAVRAEHLPHYAGGWADAAWDAVPLLRARIAELEDREQDSGAFMAYMREVLDSLPCKHGTKHLGTVTAPMMWPEAIGCALQKAREDAEAPLRTAFAAAEQRIEEGASREAALFDAEPLRSWVPRPEAWLPDRARALLAAAKKWEEHVAGGPGEWTKQEAFQLMDEARKERDALRAMLREVEWSGFTSPVTRDGRCPTCGLSKPHHAPDCGLAALLRGPDAR